MYLIRIGFSRGAAVNKNNTKAQNIQNRKQKYKTKTNIKGITDWSSVS